MSEINGVELNETEVKGFPAEIFEMCLLLEGREGEGKGEKKEREEKRYSPTKDIHE